MLSDRGDIPRLPNGGRDLSRKDVLTFFADMMLAGIDTGAYTGRRRRESIVFQQACEKVCEPLSLNRKHERRYCEICKARPTPCHICMYSVLPTLPPLEKPGRAREASGRVRVRRRGRLVGPDEEDEGRN